LKSLDERLTEVKEDIRHKQKLEKDLLQIKESLAAEREKYANLKKQLLKEGRDVEKLEGLSLSGLFLTVLGSKEAQLEKERQEYLAAKLRYDACRSEIDALEGKERDTIKQLALLEGLEAKYRELLAEKEAVILSGQGGQARLLLELSEELGELKANQKELQEAIEAGNHALLQLKKVQDSLGSAQGWGVWDILGGGLIATAIKHSRIDDARQHVHSAQQALHWFIRELKDVNPHLQTDITIDIGGFATFADYFFDGLIMDWIVQSRINESLNNVNNLVRGVSHTLRNLQQELHIVQNRLAEGYKKRQLIIEEYKKEH
jgi:DNA repair exonuclease SbcCD ATPase subunit